MTEAERAQLQTALAAVRSAASVLEALLAKPAEPKAPATGAALDMAAFYAVVRKAKLFGGALTQPQVNGCNEIVAASAGLAIAWRAYALATAYHETAFTMQPVREIGRGKGRTYGRPGRNGGQIPYGRGHVQLTHDENYERADRELNLGGALVADYDLALRPDISAKILVLGMVGGWFTGKSLRRYLPEIATREQFAAARRVVNGTDRADEIAGYAMSFQAALLAASSPENIA